MSSPSFSYEEFVLSHLEKVRELPAEVQGGIAAGVDNYIKFARTAKDSALLARIASMAMEEQAKAIGQGANTMDPRLAVPAIARHGAMPRSVCRRDIWIACMRKRLSQRSRRSQGSLAKPTNDAGKP